MLPSDKGYAWPVFFAFTLGGCGLVFGLVGAFTIGASSNLAPLVGCMAGPLSAAIGVLLGVIVMSRKAKKRTAMVVLLISAITVAFGSLCLSLQDDYLHATLVDVEVVGYHDPAEYVADAVTRWQKDGMEARLKPGWENGIANLLATDKGFVIEVVVHRKKEIYLRRKPWNNGTLDAERWKEPKEPHEMYFIRSTDKLKPNFRPGMRGIYVQHWEVPEYQLPGTNVASFLGMHTLEDVPPELAGFIGKNPPSEGQ